MMTYTSVHPRSAIAAGIFFAGVTAYVLFEDVIRHGAPINTKHVMTLAVLIGTIYFGHRFWPQLRQRALPSAVGCGLLFLGGTYMCVFMAAGRNAEVIETKNGLARSHNDERAKIEKEAEIARAAREDRKRAHADAEVAKISAAADVREQCRSGPGRLCKGALAAVEAAARSLEQAAAAVARADEQYWRTEGRLATVAPKRVENADIKAIAAVFAKVPWVTATAEAIEATHLLLLPIGMALFAEIGLIVALSIREKKEVWKAVELPPVPVREKYDPVAKALLEAGRPLSNDELAERLGVHKGTASKWVREHPRVSRVRAGREVQLTLVNGGTKH